MSILVAHHAGEHGGPGDDHVTDSADDQLARSRWHVALRVLGNPGPPVEWRWQLEKRCCWVGEEEEDDAPAAPRMPLGPYSDTHVRYWRPDTGLPSCRVDVASTRKRIEKHDPVTLMVTITELQVEADRFCLMPRYNDWLAWETTNSGWREG